jgi:hypothetical protein
MGNTICDRLFLSLANDSIDQWWSPEHQEALANLASLSTVGRQQALEKIHDKIDKEMLRFFQVSSTERPMQFEVQSASEQGNLLPLIDFHTAQRWSMDNTTTYLKDLRLLIKDAENTTTVVNEINYLTHLYLLYENYREKKKKEQQDKKPTLLSNCLEYQKTNSESAASAKAVKDTFVNGLVLVTIESLLLTAKSIMDKDDVSKLPAFTKKCNQIASAISENDRAENEDRKLTTSFENLSLAMFDVVSKFTNRGFDRDIEKLTAYTIKLSFYLGKVSFHLKVMNHLLKTGNYKNVKVGSLDDVKEIGQNWSPLTVHLETKAYNFQTADNYKGEEVRFIVEHNRMVVTTKQKKMIYNRYPDYAVYHPNCCIENSEPTGQLFLFRESTYCYSQNRIYPFKAASLRGSSNDSTDIQEGSFDLIEPETSRVTEDAPDFKISRSWALEIEGMIVTLNELKVPEGKDLKYLLKFYEKDKESNSYRRVREEFVVKAYGTEPGFDISQTSENTCVEYASGLIIIVVDGHIENLIDPFTFKAFKPPKVSNYINGVDPIRKKLLHLKDQKQHNPLSLSKFSSFSQYVLQHGFFNHISEENAKQTKDVDNCKEEENGSGNFVEYVLLLLKLVCSQDVSPFPADLQEPGGEKKGAMIYTTNKIDLTTGTFEEILDLLDQLVLSQDFDFKYQVEIGLLKILDVHLNIACLFQNNDKSTMKVLNQELIVKLRKAVMRLNLPGYYPKYSRAALDEVKLNIISNLISLSLKMKKVGEVKSLVRTLLSDSIVHSHSSVTKFFLQINKMKKLGFLNFEEFSKKFVQEVKLVIQEQVEREIEIFKKGKIAVFDPNSLIVGSNLKALFTIFAGLRSQVDEDFLKMLTVCACEQIIPSVTEVTEYLKRNCSTVIDLFDLNDVETSVLQSFGTFILAHLVTYMSYFPVWPELTASLVGMCKLFTLAAKTIKLPSLEMTSTKDAGSYIEHNFTTALGGTTDLTRNTYSFPKYMKVEVHMTGADDSRDTLMIFSEQSYDAHDQGNSDKIFRKFRTPCCIVRNNQPVVVDTNKLYLVFSTEKVKPEEDTERSIKVILAGKELAVKNSSRLETLSTICSHFVTQNLLKEIKCLNETDSLIDKLSETTAISLEAILSSPLFTNGISHEIFASIDKTFEVDTTVVTEADSRPALCQLYYLHMVQLSGINTSILSSFDELCTGLQKDALKKTLHANVMGELGFILVKSLFLVALKHYDKLDMLVYNFQEKQELVNEAELKRIWLGCTKARTVCRTFETDRQYQEFYRKLLMLMAIEPSYAWKQSQSPISPQKDSGELNEGVFKMKVYIEELRVQNASPSLTSSNELSEALLRFLSLDISANDIFKIIQQREKHFELFGKAIELILELVIQQKDNITEPLLIFNQIFRKSPDTADYLMADYNGLSQKVILERIKKISQLVEYIVEFICNLGEKEHEDEKSLLLAIESLKWMWRGKELSSVHLIDVRRIWQSCSIKYGKSEKFRLGVVDLCFILLRFCSRKAKDLQKEEEEDTLSLRRQSSVVDEHSMASILNQNFVFLIEIIGQNSERLKKMQHLLTEEELRLVLSNRNKEFIEKELVDAIVCEEPDDGELYSVEQDHIDPISTIKRKTFVKKTANDEDGDVELTEVDTPEFLSYQNAMTRINKSIEDDKKWLDCCIEEISRVLSVFYYYVYSSPEMATLFFDHEQNLLPIIDIAIGHYPDNLSIQACKILELLVPLIPSQELSNVDKFISKIVDRIRPFYQSLFTTTNISRTAIPSKSLIYCYQSLLRNLILSNFYSSDITAYLKRLDLFKCSADTLMVADLLDVDNGDVTQVGSTVYDRFDTMKEQMIVLQVSPCTFTRIYMRDILHYRFDLTADKEIADERLDRTNHYSSRHPCVIMRTKNYRYLVKNELGRFRPLFDKEALTKVINQLELNKILMSVEGKNSETDLLILYKIFNVISSTESSSFKVELSTVSKKFEDLQYYFTLEECRSAIYDRVQFLARNDKIKLPQMSTIHKNQVEESVTGLSKYQKMKERIYGKLRQAHDRSSTTKIKTYWDMQFGAQKDEKKFNLNIASFKPSLDTSINFDTPSPDLCSGKNSTTDACNILKNGIAQSYLMYSFCTRTDSDFKHLVQRFADYHTTLSMRHHNMIDTVESNTTIEILLSEAKSKDILYDLCDELFRKSSTFLPSTLLLLSKITKRCQNKDLSVQYAYFLLFQIHRLTTVDRDQVLNNNTMLNCYITALETCATLARVLPKHSIKLDGERLTQFEEILECIIVPDFVDSYAYRRQHKIEYLQNILIHFARHVLLYAEVDLALMKNKPVLEWFTWQNTLLQELTVDNQVSDDFLIRGILLQHLYQPNNGQENLIKEKYGHTLDCKRPYKELDLSNYRYWTFYSEVNCEPIECSILKKPTDGVATRLAYIPNQQFDADFGRKVPFEVDPTDGKYYLCHRMPDNFVIYNHNLAFMEFMIRYGADKDPMLFNGVGTANCGVFGNHLIKEIQGSVHTHFSGVSAFLVDGSNANWEICYLKESKELIQIHGKEAERRNMNHPFHYLCASREYQVFWSCDLSKFPEVRRIAASDEIILCVDVEGGVIVLEKNDNKREAIINATGCEFIGEHEFDGESQLYTFAYFKNFCKKIVDCKYFSGDLIFIAQSAEGLQVSSTNANKMVLVPDQIYRSCMINDSSIWVHTNHGLVFHFNRDLDRMTRMERDQFICIFNQDGEIYGARKDPEKGKIIYVKFEGSEESLEFEKTDKYIPTESTWFAESCSSPTDLNLSVKFGQEYSQYPNLDSIDLSILVPERRYPVTISSWHETPKLAFGECGEPKGAVLIEGASNAEEEQGNELNNDQEKENTDFDQENSSPTENQESKQEHKESEIENLNEPMEEKAAVDDTKIYDSEEIQVKILESGIEDSSKNNEMKNETSSRKEDQPDYQMKRSWISITMYHPLHGRDESFLADLVTEYRNCDQFESPDEKSKRPQFYYWKTDFSLHSAESEWPSCIEDLVAVIKVVGRPKVVLESIKQRLMEGASYSLSGDENKKYVIMPDILKLSPEEFQRFKQDNEAVWKPRIDEVRQSFVAKRQIVSDILRKKLEDENYDRLNAFKLFEPEHYINNTTEWRSYYSYQGPREEPDEAELRLISTIYYSLLMPNYAYLNYLNILPTYQRKSFDLDFKEKAEKNVFGIFMFNNLRKFEFDNYANLYVNRMKALNHTTLKRQNISLLNQFCYSFEKSSADRIRAERFATDGMEVNFTGEGRFSFK